MKETKLTGGSVSAPVKVGDTVRRPAGVWTPTLHALLVFLAEQGFGHAPQPLGLDEQGREVLTYLPGKSALRPWPAVVKTDDGLRQVAAMLREYHEVVAGWRPPADAVWRVGHVPWRSGQIIRHGDLGPWNTLWQDDRLTGLIDWDFAEPGERITDVAQLAWYFVPLRGEQHWRDAGFAERPDFARRLAVLAEAYGGVSVAEVVRELDRLQHFDMDRTRTLGGAGVYPWRLFWDRGGMETLRRENEWLAEVLGDILGR